MRYVRRLLITRWRIGLPRETRSRLVFAGPCREGRRLGLSTLATILTPPAVFGGLVVTLWTYKCMMMVIFQNKIIYMPGIPPFARSEKVADYAAQCRPVEWREYSITSTDGTKIKLLDGHIPKKEVKRNVVILYFQGNAGSTPPRLPYLSAILKEVEKTAPFDISYSILALSYRGFWTSSGRPSQQGIEMDATAALQWIFERYPAHCTDVIIWGQSIGAGVATTSLRHMLISEPNTDRAAMVKGLLLETPFVDIASMLVALYPQKFLPYRYLTPFLKSSWDSRGALNAVGRSKTLRPRVLILQAGDDEIVPSDHAGILHSICQNHGLDVAHKVVTGALHTEIMARAQGRLSIANFFSNIR